MNLCTGQSVPSGDTLARVLEAYPIVNAEWLVIGRGERERVRLPVPEIEDAWDLVTAVVAENNERARAYADETICQ